MIRRIMQIEIEPLDPDEGMPDWVCNVTIRDPLTGQVVTKLLLQDRTEWVGPHD